MLVFGEIVIEIAMIVAVVGGFFCLAYLLRLTILERLYIRRLRRGFGKGTSRHA